MSGSILPTQLSQGQSSALGSGIVGLFIHGIEAGLVFSQFTRWFYGSGRSESSLLSTIIVFVTIIGFAQSGLSFASAWSKYVRQFGMFPIPDWEDYVQPIPTLVISIPVQALMTRRCYYLVGKNVFIIVSSTAHHKERAEPFITQTPLVLLLVASTIATLWAAVTIITCVTSIKTAALILEPRRTDTSWPFLMSVLLPSVLDLALTAILLHNLTRTMKQVYAAHTRKRISRLVNIVWQSALPPTLGAICLTGFYIQYSTMPQVPSESPYWFLALHGTIGKLYVLSLLHMVNAQPLQLDEQHTTFLSTFTVPAEVLHTLQFYEVMRAWTNPALLQGPQV
ncbi:hypothetical protein EDB87DRAFT_1831312 [Lactarius vividus]|nr:hypothetical protein EDB87DRAFT_1831312 [Lactarius vividus]